MLLNIVVCFLFFLLFVFMAHAACTKHEFDPLNWFASKVRDRIVLKRPLPDVCIGGDGTPTGCYMRRWWVIPRNRYFNIYLHRFQHDDDDRAHHDHPWWNISYLIEGSYVEHCTVEVEPNKFAVVRRLRHAGEWALRPATARHRVELASDRKPCWTFFITGANRRTWGFWCPRVDGSQRFVDWKTFTGVDHNKTGSGPAHVGRGCGEED